MMVAYRIMWKQTGKKRYIPYVQMYSKVLAEKELKKLNDTAGADEKFKIKEVNYAYDGILDKIVEMKGGVYRND